MRKRKTAAPWATPSQLNWWTLEYSPGCVWMPGEGQGAVDIPIYDLDPNQADHLQLPSLHYLTRPGSLMGASMRARGRIVAAEGARLVPTQGEPPARMRLYFQRLGDGMTWEYINYRWWSPPLVLVPGEFDIEYWYLPEIWTNVGGQAGTGDNFPLFSRALANVGRVGMTFGGTFAGHGVVAQGGPVRFELLEFGVQ